MPRPPCDRQHNNLAMSKPRVDDLITGNPKITRKVTVEAIVTPPKDQDINHAPRQLPSVCNPPKAIAGLHGTIIHIQNHSARRLASRDRRRLLDEPVYRPENSNRNAKWHLGGERTAIVDGRQITGRSTKHR